MTNHSSSPSADTPRDASRPGTLWIDFDLLDRQIIDLAGNKLGKVDDIELVTGADGRLTVSDLLVGQSALGRRIGGWVGRCMHGIAERLRPEQDPPPLRIPFEHVTQIDSEITVGLRAELFPTPPLESWLRDKLIGRIPGARDESQ
jgi:sporulation protein YlmC with PRC-barrel domain